MWNDSARRMGLWSAASVAGLGIVYVAVGAIGVAMRPPGLPTLAQVDPCLAILEALIILSAIALVAMIAAIHAYAGARATTLAALAFMTAFATVTSAAHFVSLTVGRQSAAENPLLARELSFEWPSVALSLDLLAWEVFLGLALVFAAPAFEGGRLEAAIRLMMYTAGVLSLAGVAGPLSGNLVFDYPAILGRAFVLPAICVMIAILFARKARN